MVDFTLLFDEVAFSGSVHRLIASSTKWFGGFLFLGSLLLCWRLFLRGFLLWDFWRLIECLDFLFRRGLASDLLWLGFQIGLFYKGLVFSPGVYPVCLEVGSCYSQVSLSTFYTGLIVISYDITS